MKISPFDNFAKILTIKLTKEEYFRSLRIYFAKLIKYTYYLKNTTILYHNISMIITITFLFTHKVRNIIILSIHNMFFKLSG